MAGLLKKVAVTVLLMLVIVLPAQAQIAVSPNPAQIGQVVTIRNTSSDSSHRLLNCRIEGQGSYGDITAGQSVTFTIPQDAQPGSSYTFACDGYTSSSSEFPSPVNPVSINVAASPPADSDGDGIPDDQDQCPNQPAPNSNNGCPPQQPPPPSNPDVDTDGDTVPDSEDLCPADPGIPEWNGCPDADGDGLTTQYDNCPNQPGSRENLGCPDQSQPVPTQSAPAPAVVLPALPDDGQCYIATRSATPVNIREGTATTTDIVGSLAPRLIYPVGRVTLDESDQRWFLLTDGGYVASFVVRSTPACDALIPDSADVQAVSLDVTGAFSDCPDLLAAAADVPVFVLFEAADSADPCAVLEDALNDLFFGAAMPLNLSTYEVLNLMLDECTLQAMLAISLLGGQSESGTPIEQATNDLGCGTSFTYNGLVLLNLATLSGSSERDRVLNGDLTPAEAAVRAVIEGECGLIWQPYGQEILLYLLAITESDSELLGIMSDICDYIDWMLNGIGVPGWFAVAPDPFTINQERYLNGNLNAEEIRLRDALEAECGIQWDPYGQYIFLSQLAHGEFIPDLRAIFALLVTDPSAFCDRMWSLLPGGEQLRSDPQTTPPEVERIARGDLTADEAALRNQIETICGLYWEPYGRVVLVQLSSLDSIALVLDLLATSPQNTCRQLYAMLGLRGQPPLPGLTDDQQATTERIGRGDLTDEESDLRTFMETACSIAWEPGGREIMVYLLNHGGYDSGSVDDLIGVIIVDREPDPNPLDLLGSDEPAGSLSVAEACANLLDLASDYLRMWGTAEEADPYDDEDAAYMESRMRDRIERGDLSSAESQLRTALLETCGLLWEWGARELLVQLALAGDVDASLVRFAANSDAFCASMRNRAAEFSPLLRTAAFGSLPLFSLINGTATEERMATSGDYTPSETALRGILEHRCGIGWEAGGFRLMVNIIDSEAVEDALREFSDAPSDFCEDISESEELYAADLTATAITQLDPRTATERRLAGSVRLTVDELRLRGILGVSCGIPWDPYGLRLLAGYIDSDTVETAVDAHNADPVAFCEARIAEAIAMGMPAPEERTIERADDIEPRELITPLPGATGTPDSDRRLLIPGDAAEDTEPTDAEITTLRNLIQDCGLMGEVVNELLTSIIAAGLTEDAIAVQAVNPDAFCNEMRRLASVSPPVTDETDLPVEDTDTLPQASDTVADDVQRELSSFFDAFFTTPASSLAVFQIETEQDGIQRLYLLDTDGEFVEIPENIDGDALLPALSPDSDQLAFIQIALDGTRQLALLDFISPVSPTVSTISLPGTVSESSPAWLSDGRLLVSVENDASHSDIWLIDISDETGEPILWMANATAPAIDSRERNVAFVRSTDGIPNVFTAALIDGNARPITQNTTGCESPRFGATPFVLYYRCEQTLYRYGVGGASPLVDGVQAYVPAPVAGFLVYSDDNTLYLLDESTGESSSLPSPDGLINMFDWGQSR